MATDFSDFLDAFIPDSQPLDMGPNFGSTGDDARAVLGQFIDGIIPPETYLEATQEPKKVKQPQTRSRAEGLMEPPAKKSKPDKPKTRVDYLIEEAKKKRKNPKGLKLEVPKRPEASEVGIVGSEGICLNMLIFR